ncbi:uncharacterized protein B0H18DRAFT_1215366 [Fomitopsis serialis]|uniref:uncharacterized protein n=1 Tax=Fomitopsis serialis TaxID=139415 RepID=UPI002008D703|nr:uncharacterized protein B0H18DRAFT_1215366 [Neoantrodia serialis]KAH9915667.1 hypothetical protein B0H18DRAFT_1215366 [Neoantrodia serialis]
MLTVARTSWSNAQHYFLKSEIQEVADTWRQLLDARDHVQLGKFTTERIWHVARLHEFQDSCITWLEKQQSALRREQDCLKKERLNDISARLLALGWAPELDMLKQKGSERLSGHRLVCMTSKLTDHGWRRIKGEMIDFMQGIRKQRLDHEFNEALAKRWVVFENTANELLDEYLNGHQEMRTYGLNLADLVRTPEFRDIMCVCTDTQVDKQSFMALRAQMETIVEGWKLRACDALRQMIRHTAQASMDPGVDTLKLATTMFECKRCRRYLVHPNLLAHKCLRSGRAPMFAFSNHHGIYEASARTFFPATFQVRSPNFEVVSPRSARRIIRICKKDPDTVTAKELDSSDIRLVRDDTIIMTWRAVILLYFQPQDLLSVSRTSKAFHAFLMKKSSARYWKESLERLKGPPPFPKDMIEPAWVALLFSPHCTGVRDELLARALRQRLTGRWSDFQFVWERPLQQYMIAHPELWTWGLKLADLAFMPEFRGHLCAPTGRLVDRDTFRYLLRHTGTIVEGWKTHVCDQLRQHMRGKTRVTKKVDPLELATTMFRCSVCAAYLFFPNLLAHQCQRSSPAEQNTFAQFVHSKSDGYRFEYGSAFSPRLREYEPSEQARQIIRFCGKDPNTATAKDMDELDIRLIRGKVIMTWRTAMIEQTQFDDEISNWRIADPEAIARSKECERKIVEELSLWICIPCMPQYLYYSSWHTIKKDLEVDHGIEEPSVEKGHMMYAKTPHDMYGSGVFKFKMPSYEVLWVSARSTGTKRSS